MITVNFENTKIPEDISHDMASYNFILGAMHVAKVVKIALIATSKCLQDIKEAGKTKAVVFRTIDGRFIAGAMVKLVKNKDEDGASTSQWTYTWTFDENDITDDMVVVDVSKTSMFMPYVVQCASMLFSMQFGDNDTAIMMITKVIDAISHWLDDNAAEGATLTMNNLFTATAETKDGKIEKSFTPTGEMATIIKGDEGIQAA